MQFRRGEFVIRCDILKKTFASESERTAGERDREGQWREGDGTKMNERDKQQMMERKMEGVERATARSSNQQQAL